MKPVDMVQSQIQLDALRLLPADGTDATSYKTVHGPATKRLEEPAIAQALHTLEARGLVGTSFYRYRLTRAGQQVLTALGNTTVLEPLTIAQAQALVADANVEDYQLQGLKDSLIDDDYYPTEPGVEDAVEQGWLAMASWTADVLARIAV